MSILVKKKDHGMRRKTGGRLVVELRLYMHVYIMEVLCKYVYACRREEGTIKRTSRRIIQCAWYVEVQYEREIEREGEIRTEVGCTSVSNLIKNKRKDRGQ